MDQPTSSGVYVMSIEYKFREDELLEELKQYIDKTYTQHYSDGIQSFEVAISRNTALPGARFNIDKYNDRYGKKGDSPEVWRKDIVKIIHYGILALYCHDLEHSAEVSDEESKFFTGRKRIKGL